MNTLFRSTRITFTVWVLAALINAALSAILLSLHSDRFIHFPVTCLFAFVFSLLFSLPGIFIFWLVFINHLRHERLFRLLLQTGLITAFIADMVFLFLLGAQFKGQSFYLSLFAIIAAIAAIMIHYDAIQSITRSSKINTHV